MCRRPLFALVLLGFSLPLASPHSARGAEKSKRPALELPKELTPSSFTFQAKDISVARALEELAKQTGNEVQDRRDAKEDVKLTLDLKKATFWQALDAIAKAADARVSLFERDGKLALLDGPHQVLPVSYSGLFRVSIKRMDVVRLLEMDVHDCLISVEVAWEPRFRPLFMEMVPDGLEVRDDKGRAIEVTEGEKGMGAVKGRIATDLQIRIPAPHRSAAQLSLFKGNLKILGPSKTLTFTFDKLAKIDKRADARKETQDGVTVNVHDLKPEGQEEDQVWAIGVLLEYPTDGPKFESFQSWLVNNEVYLEREKEGIKQRFPPNLGYETVEETDNKAMIRYRFGDEPEKKLLLGKLADWKLVYRTPGKIAAVPIPFEFKDVPLP